MNEISEAGDNSERKIPREGLSPEYKREDKGMMALYSAENLLQKGEKMGSVHYESAKYANGIEIDMLAVLSPEHVPLDAVAVWVSDDGKEIRWAKADGVSNIEKGLKNESGLMADWLAKQVASRVLLDRPEDVVALVDNEMEKFNYQGAATVEYGRIRKENDRWIVEVFRIGSTIKDTEEGVVSGDSGVLEAYYSDETNEEPHAVHNADTNREFAGRNGVGVMKRRSYLSGQELTFTIATDGVKAIVDGQYINSGMRVERWIRAAGKLNTTVTEIVERARKNGFLSAGDDISLVSIHLPKDANA